MEARSVLRATLQRLVQAKTLQDAIDKLSAASHSLLGGQHVDDDAAASIEAAACAGNAARLAQQACSDLRLALAAPAPRQQPSDPCDSGRGLLKSLELLEGLKVKVAKVIAYARHRASAFEGGLLEACGNPSVATGFRTFWDSVEKQLARLLGAIHKAVSLSEAGGRPTAPSCGYESRVGSLPSAADVEQLHPRCLDGLNRDGGRGSRALIASSPSRTSSSTARVPRSARPGRPSSPPATQNHQPISSSCSHQVSVNPLQLSGIGPDDSDGDRKSTTPNRRYQDHTTPKKVVQTSSSSSRLPLGELKLNGQQLAGEGPPALDINVVSNLQVQLLEAVKGMRKRLSSGGCMHGKEPLADGDDLYDLLAVPSP